MKKSLSKLQLKKLRKTLVKKGNSKSNISKVVNSAKKLSVKYFNSPWVKGKGGGKFGKFRKLDFDGDGKVIKSLDMHHLEEMQSILDKHNITTKEQANMCMELFDVDNVQILCKFDHKQTDSYSIHSKKKK